MLLLQCRQYGESPFGSLFPPGKIVFKVLCSSLWLTVTNRIVQSAWNLRGENQGKSKCGGKPGIYKSIFFAEFCLSGYIWVVHINLIALSDNVTEGDSDECINTFINSHLHICGGCTVREWGSKKIRLRQWTCESKNRIFWLAITATNGLIQTTWHLICQGIPRLFSLFAPELHRSPFNNQLSLNSIVNPRAAASLHYWLRGQQLLSNHQWVYELFLKLLLGHGYKYNYIRVLSTWFNLQWTSSDPYLTPGTHLRTVISPFLQSFYTTI